METKEIVSELLKNGAKKVSDVVVRNVTVTVKDEYTRFGITIDKEVDGYIAGEDGTFVEGSTKVIFTSSFSIASLLKDNDDAAFAVNHLVKHPDALAMIMSRARIDIVQQHVTAGEEYTNPFSTNSDPVVFDHDTIINHIVKLELSDFGIRRLDVLADKMLGF